MNWRLKAFIQSAIASLPAAAGDSLYYQLQRRLGSLKSLDPADHFRMAGRVDELARERGGRVEGSAIVEVGTGWDLAVPLAFWLGGAARVLTVDLHRHVRPELVRQVCAFLRDQPERAEEALGSLAHFPGYGERRDHVLRALEASRDLELPQEIEYRAPADASRLGDPAGSIDFHVSRSVLEHVPPDQITAILREGRRIVRSGGWLLHAVDFSDHFAHSDTSLPSVHFLRYSDAEWRRLAGNRFMFHNRLRVDDFAALFRAAGLESHVVAPRIDARALRALRDSLRVDARFRTKSDEILATSEAWFAAESP